MTSVIFPLCHPHQPWPHIPPHLSPHLRHPVGLGGQHGGPATAPKHRGLEQRDETEEKPTHVVADGHPAPAASGRVMLRSSRPRIPGANPRGCICFVLHGKPYINFKNSLTEKSADNS